MQRKTVVCPLFRHIRGDLYSMQYKIIFSEITGGVPVHKHPGIDWECPALSVRYETKMSKQEMML